MRIFVYILSLFITVLSIVPCKDGMPQSSNNLDPKVSITEHDHNDSDHQDDCSPFCVCACCGSIITLPIIQSIEETKADISTDYIFHYTFYYSFDYIQGVWRPPSYS